MTLDEIRETIGSVLDVLYVSENPHWLQASSAALRNAADELEKLAKQDQQP